MSDENTASTETTKSSSKALPLFIILFIASLGFCVYLFVKYAKNTDTIIAQNEELTLAYEMLDLKADSLQKDLDFALAQLQNKINENLALTDLKDELRQQLLKKQKKLIAAHARISKLISKGAIGGNEDSPKALLAAKSEIATLKDSNQKYIAKIEETQKQYISAKRLAAENASKVDVLTSTSDSLQTVKIKLEEKLSTASLLRLAELQVSGIRERKGKQEITDKANRVNRLQIHFVLQESKLTAKERKELIIRIIEPNGKILSEEVSTLTDKTEIYSLNETVVYNGTEKEVTYYYDQDASYAKGIYQIEIYNNDILLDRKNFKLR